MGLESSTENYTVGRGQGYFNRKTAGVYEGMRNLGNIKSLTSSVSMEKLPHYSTKSKYRTKDKEAILEVNPKLKIVLDEISAENFAMLFLATVTEVTQIVTATADVTIEDVKLGYIYDIGKKFINPVGFAVKVAAATKVKDVDYTIDYRTGKIAIKTGGTIVAGDDIIVSCALLAQKYKELNAFKESSIEGEFFYASENAAGTNQQITFYSVSLTPTGDTILITDGTDWSTIELEGEILADFARDSESPYGKVIVID